MRDTIVAIATGHAAGGIGIVRLSGAHAPAIAAEIAGREPEARRPRLARFRDAAGDTLDRGLVLWFPAPHSYTGEHVVELHAHGSVPVLQSLVRRCLELGARPARAGEFSERAFLEGRLDLAQAEAVADLIASGSEAQARAALRSLEGEFSARVEHLQARLIRVRVELEAGLDFPDEELDLAGSAALRVELAGLVEDTRDLLAASARGRRLRDGLHVVIVGAPNVGKSSLLNALADSPRAIVTEIPGTTRDLLREAIRIDGIELLLVDTAGLRATDDPIEAEGVRRAEQERRAADLELLVLDASAPGSTPEWPPAVAPRLVVHNKCDLLARAPPPDRAGGPAPDTAIAPGVVHVSARTGAGIETLRRLLARAAGSDEAGAGTFSARARHVHALERTLVHLAAAADEQLAPELLAEELRLAQLELDGITGRHTSDELLGEIFASFCIGK